MPIYEYYCAACHGRFSHLARRFDEPAPPCPRCGQQEVERLISTSNLVHGASHHEKDLRSEAAHVDDGDPQAIARFLKASGRLEDASGLYGSKAYRELIARRAEGASDRDLADLVDDLTAEAETSEAAKMAGSVVLSKQMENRMGAEGPPDHQDHGDQQSDTPRSRRSADDLGWS